MFQQELGRLLARNRSEDSYLAGGAAILGLDALDSAKQFIQSRPPDEAGCLCYSLTLEKFINPNRRDAGNVTPHFGRPGGVLPRFAE